jgi:hypothetical protein
MTVSITLSFCPSVPNVSPFQTSTVEIYMYFYLLHGVPRVPATRTLLTRCFSLAAERLSILSRMPINNVLNLMELRPRGEGNTVGLYINPLKTKCICFI